MGLNLWTILGVLGLTLLTLLLTGPGMWSEKWGWGLFDRPADRKKKEPGAAERRDGGPPRA